MKRILSALVLFPIVLLVLILGNKYIVDVFISIIAIMTIHELFKAFEQKGYHPIKWIGYLAAVLMIFIHIIPEQYLLAFLLAIVAISILIAFATLITKKINANVIDIAITIFSVCYIVLFLSCASIIHAMENGKFLIWYLLIPAWATDIFAYCTGMAIGKHHFTDISPKKTIEGCIGGTLGAIICVLLYTLAINQLAGLNINYFVIAIIGAVLSVIGQLGDLSASSIKRYVGIKDYSNLIPGHGGMLDRIDSVIFISPFAYFLLMLLV